MKKTLKTIPVGTTQVRYMVTYTSDPCPEHGQESLVQLAHLLGTIVGQPQFLYCGPVVMEKMKVSYAGSAWMAELEAVGDDPTRKI